MRNRDDNNWDVPGRRFRDERYGGRRTGYANTDPDFHPDYPRHQGDVSLRGGGGWDEDREERLGWERRSGGGGGGRDFNDWPQSRMDLPYSGEEGGYINRGGGYGAERQLGGREGFGQRGGSYGNMQTGGYYGRGGQMYGRGGDYTRNLRDWDRSPGYRGGMDIDNDMRFAGGYGGGGQQFGGGGPHYGGGQFAGGRGGYGGGGQQFGGGGNRMWDEDWRDVRGGDPGEGGYGGARGYGGGRSLRGGNVERDTREGDFDRFGGGGRSFRGMGPKGYSRSVDRIREDICEMLTDAPHIDPSNVELDVDKNGLVTLRGEVNSRREKRLIEDCVDRVRGVRDVRNELVLRKGSEGQQVVGRNGNGAGRESNVGQTTSASGRGGLGATSGGGGKSKKGGTSGQIDKPS